MLNAEESVINIVQARAQSLDNDYLTHIKTTVLIAWGIISERRAWSFLRCSDAEDIAIVANQSTYLIENEQVQFVEDIQNSNGVSIIGYRTYKDFVRLRDRDQTNPIMNWTDLIALSLGQQNTGGYQTPIFTDRSRQGQSLVIQIYPVPTETFTAKLIYTEKGSKDNFEKMTAGAVRACAELALSMIGPPKEMDKGQWRAITVDSFKLAEVMIESMATLEPLQADYTPGIMHDPYIANQLDRI